MLGALPIVCHFFYRLGTPLPSSVALGGHSEEVEELALERIELGREALDQATVGVVEMLAR